MKLLIDVAVMCFIFFSWWLSWHYLSKSGLSLKRKPPFITCPPSGSYLIPSSQVPCRVVHIFIGLFRCLVLVFYFHHGLRYCLHFLLETFFSPWILKVDSFLRLLPPDLSLPMNLYNIYHVVYFLDVKKYIYVFFENFRHSCIFIIVCYCFLFKTGPPIWPRMASNSQ